MVKIRRSRSLLFRLASAKMARKVKRKADSALNFLTRHKKKLIVIAVVVALVNTYIITQ